MTSGWTEPLDPPVRVRAGDPHDGDRGHGAGQEGDPHGGGHGGLGHHGQLPAAGLGRFRVRGQRSTHGRAAVAAAVHGDGDGILGTLHSFFL